MHDLRHGLGDGLLVLDLLLDITRQGVVGTAEEVHAAGSVGGDDGGGRG